MKISKEIKDKSKLTKEEWKEFTKTVWHIANTTHSEHPAVFPKEIPHRLIKLFTFWGETVLDPFAGVGTTVESALENGRKAICIDINRKYVSIMRKKVEKLNGNKKDVKVILGDSRSLKEIKNDSIGLIVTSPPYWDKADYGKNKKNLGLIENYTEFFRQISDVLKESYRVLMPGRKLCIVTANVNLYTDHGLLTFPLSSDYVQSLRDIGFVMINEIIWSKDRTGGKWGSYGVQRPIFGSYPYPPNFLFKNVHEYIIIFAKPDPKKKTSNKAKSYEEVMGL